MMTLTFVWVALAASLFVIGSVCLVRCLGLACDGKMLPSALFGVFGLSLKYPAVLIALNIAKTGSEGERGGAMAAVSLVYFVSVAGASFYGLRQNRKDQ